MPRYSLLPVLGLFAGLMLLAQPGHAGNNIPDISDIRSGNIFDAGRRVREAMQEILPDKNTPVFIREFRGFASSHVALSKCIADEMATAGYTVKEGAPIELEGRLLRLPLRDDGGPFKGFTVRCTLNMDDGTQQNFSIDIENPDQGHVAVSETGELAAPPTKPNGSVPSELPPAFDNFEIKPAADSPYGITILAERGPGNYVPLKPIKDGKLLKVPLQKGMIYAVRVHNHTNFEAATSVHIDGLSRYAMADDPAFKDGLDLVPPQSHRDIAGYYRDGHTVDSFQIGEYSESAAAQLLPSTPDIGLICVTFAACWEGDPRNAPPNEPDGFKSVDPPGTKPGPKRADPTQTVKRNVGKLRALVKVRY